MKVLLISRSFKKGGSATGSNNLFNSLSSIGLKCIKIDADDYLSKTFLLKYIRILERILEVVLGGRECHFLKLGPNTFDIKNLIKQHKPDIIQMCDISNNVINPFSADKVEIPLFHRLSDFWPYKGPYHYPIKKNFMQLFIHKIFIRYIKKNSDKYPILICPSKWTMDNIKSNSKKYFIRNAVNKISKNSKVINHKGIIKLGFISMNLNNKRKGLKQLIEILNQSNHSFEIELLLFGELKEKIKVRNKNLKISLQGSYSKNNLYGIYESFDILICPSRYDNSPNVVTEAIASGTPVIGQKNSGIDSYINLNSGRLIDFYLNNKINLIKNFEINLREIINEYNQLSKNCIKFADQELSKKIVGESYLEIYKKTIIDL